MQSLRARLLVSVLALAGLGLIALGAVTYAEQRSFLYGRVDQQARSAINAISRNLDARGILPPGAKLKLHEQEARKAQKQAEQGHGEEQQPSDESTQQQTPGPSGSRGRPLPFVALPPGTFGQRRDVHGHVLGAELLSVGNNESEPAQPRLPANIPLKRVITVNSYGSSGLHWRVYAQHDPEDSAITIVAVPLSDVDQTLHRLLIVEAIVFAGVLLALGLSAYFVVRAGLRPLDRIEVTAGQIAAGDLDRRVSPADERTEVGRLGLALNGMLERLEHAFSAQKSSEDRLRQFLADASHELRTPLASIRGYAELFRMGATTGTGDTETAMRRIEEEAKRMGVLVEDLLALARLDEEPEREPGPIDLATLAGDAVTDARATAPEREISLDAPSPAVVIAEELQVRQVLANLLRNAILHTPAGTPIEVGVTEQPGWVTLRVADHGPGIPAEARHRLFERFWRKEGGRERGRGGAGLGLAIVDGVVTAHGGTVKVTDTPGGGATFEVRLPAAEVPAPAGEPS